MIIYCIVTAFLNAIAAIVLGGSVLWQSPARRQTYLFAWFIVSFAAWSIFYLLWQLASSEDEALLYARLLTGASVFIPVTYFHFVSRLMSRDEVLEIRLGYAAAVGVALFTFSPYLVKGVGPIMMFPYWPQPGIVFWPWLATFGYFIARAWLFLYKCLQESTHWRRRQLMYLYIGSVAGWLGGLTNLFLWFGIPIPPFGNGLSLIYIVAVAYATMRFRLVDLNVFAVKALVYLSVVSLLSLIFPIIMMVFRASVAAEILEIVSVGEYIGAFVVTLGLFFCVPRVMHLVNLFLEEKALGGIIGNPHRLREHIHRVAALGPEEIFKDSVRVVSEELKVPQVEIYCRSDFDGDYGLKASAADDWVFFERRRLEDDHWLVRTTRLSGEALVVYEQDRSSDSADAISACEQAGVELAIPIYADRAFYGILLCGRPTENRLYSDLDISLLEALCIQIGLTIRARELERRSNRTEKLIALGTLAAGLAHEIRNPLVSIRTFADLLDKQGVDMEFQRQFSSVVGRDVRRIGAIIDQVGVFANNAEASFNPVDLAEVICDVQSIAQQDLDAGGVGLVVQEASLPAVRGNHSQLIQVFLNLVQNATHALRGMEAPVIRISFRVKPRKDGAQAVVVTVEDNGPGIPAGIRPRIFDPFVTTRNTGTGEDDRGMGLGLGIAKGIVEAHGGTIDVSSTTGIGTAFYVELPCEEGQAGLVVKAAQVKNRGGWRPFMNDS